MKRRTALALGASAMASISGCIFGGDDSNSSNGGELLTEDKERIIRTGEGIEARLRSVTHRPSEGRATVTAEIKVPQEDRYRVRLGVIDSPPRPVVLAADIQEPTLYGTGWDLVKSELRVDECGACYSGLCEVEFSTRSDKVQEEEQAQRERENNQDSSPSPPTPANETAGSESNTDTNESQ